MRRTPLVPMVIVFAAACSGGEAGTVVSDGLQRDLELARSSGVELAAAGMPSQQVVSALEMNGGPTPNRAPDRVSRTRDGSALRVANAPKPRARQVAKAPDPVDPPLVVMAWDTATAPVPSVEPTIPTPQPVTIPREGRDAGGGSGDVGSGRGSDIGRVLGGILVGVVLRGGGVGDDHCVPRGRGRTPGGGVLINDRMPPIMGPTTFPRDFISDATPASPVGRVATRGMGAGRRGY